MSILADELTPLEDESPLRSVATAVAVLDCFDAEPELGATRVAARLGIAKSTACRMLAALATGGLLERTGSGRYRLGLRLFEYGQLAVDRHLLRETALPQLGEQLRTDVENLRAALAGVDVTEAFLPSTSPRGFGRNEYYASEAEYYEAVGAAMREEYLGIVEILSDPGLSPGERDRTAREHVDIVNHALRGIPADRIRLHTCYGLNHGPRVHDISMREVAPYMLAVHAGAYSFEVANPRHMHEWRIGADIALPEGAILIPGLLGHAQNYVEHPELVADMIGWYSSLVGAENVIARADCGFSSRASYAPEVDAAVVWEKFRALAEGAAIATKRR